jgi:hypothetical protein
MEPELYEPPPEYKNGYKPMSEAAE